MAQNFVLTFLRCSIWYIHGKMQEFGVTPEVDWFKAAVSYALDGKDRERPLLSDAPHTHSRTHILTRIRLEEGFHGMSALTT